MFGRCWNCGHDLDEDEVCPNCDYEDEDEDNLDDPQKYDKCGCPFCFCANMTVAGCVCSDCQSGAHQG